MLKILRVEKVSMDKEHNHRGYSRTKAGTIGETRGNSTVNDNEEYMCEQIHSKVSKLLNS